MDCCLAQSFTESLLDEQDIQSVGLLLSFTKWVIFVCDLIDYEFSQFIEQILSKQSFNSDSFSASQPQVVDKEANEWNDLSQLLFEKNLLERNISIDGKRQWTVNSIVMQTLVQILSVVRPYSIYMVKVVMEKVSSKLFGYGVKLKGEFLQEYANHASRKEIDKVHINYDMKFFKDTVFSVKGNMQIPMLITKMATYLKDNAPEAPSECEEEKLAEYCSNSDITQDLMFALIKYAAGILNSIGRKWTDFLPVNLKTGEPKLGLSQQDEQKIYHTFYYKGDAPDENFEVAEEFLVALEPLKRGIVDLLVNALSFALFGETLDKEAFLAYLLKSTLLGHIFKHGNPAQYDTEEFYEIREFFIDLFGVRVTELELFNRIAFVTDDFEHLILEENEPINEPTEKLEYLQNIYYELIKKKYEFNEKFLLSESQLQEFVRSKVGLPYQHTSLEQIYRISIYNELNVLCEEEEFEHYSLAHFVSIILNLNFQHYDALIQETYSRNVIINRVLAVFRLNFDRVKSDKNDIKLALRELAYYYVNNINFELCTKQDILAMYECDNPDITMASREDKLLYNDYMLFLQTWKRNAQRDSEAANATRNIEHANANKEILFESSSTEESTTSKCEQARSMCSVIYNGKLSSGESSSL